MNVVNSRTCNVTTYSIFAHAVFLPQKLRNTNTHRKNGMYQFKLWSAVENIKTPIIWLGTTRIKTPIILLGTIRNMKTYCCKCCEDLVEKWYLARGKTEWIDSHSIRYLYQHNLIRTFGCLHKAIKNDCFQLLISLSGFFPFIYNYEWSKQTKFLLAVIWMSPQRHSNSSETFKKIGFFLKF